MRGADRPAGMVLRLAAAALASALAGAPCANAQRQGGLRASDLSPNDKVRVTVRDARAPVRVGTFVTFAGDTLVMLPNTRPARSVARLPFETVRRLEVSTGEGVCGGGRRPACVLLGGLAGLVVVAELDREIYGPRHSQPTGLTLIGAPVGLIAGFIVGGAVAGDKWQTVALPGRP